MESKANVRTSLPPRRVKKDNRREEAEEIDCGCGCGGGCSCSDGCGADVGDAAAAGAIRGARAAATA